MILVDTALWVAHFKGMEGAALLVVLLNSMGDNSSVLRRFR